MAASENARASYRRGSNGAGSRPALIVGAAIGLLIAVVVFIAWFFVDPAPPRQIAIATGTPGGFYDRLGQAYRDRLQANGLTVTLVPSNGSIDNLGALEQGDVDLAFLQGGVVPEPRPTSLTSLASVALEPFWVFTRTPEPLARFEDLSGQVIAVGPTGSGTRRLALTLLDAVGMLEQLRLDGRSGEAAAEALIRGEIGAAMFVTAPETATIQVLLSEPTVSLARLERARGIAHVFPYLSTLDVPEGAFDLEANRPRADTTLLAPATTLVAQEDLHPAITALVLDVAGAVHSNGRAFGTDGGFPSAKFLELPLSEEARRYFERGPTFLRRYMPFWAANLVERLWVLVIPLITVMIPLFRVAPPAYRWQIRRRIYRWYDDLRELETRGREAQSDQARREIVADLNALEAEVGTIRVPLPYTDDLYHLRLHIDYVTRLLGGEPLGQIHNAGDETGTAQA